MSQFSLDFRAARRNAGLSQADCAHLLGADPGSISAIELGRRLPTLTQIICLCLVFGRSFESLFAELMGQARRDILERLGTLPATVRVTASNRNRDATLARLGQRLVAEIEKSV